MQAVESKTEQMPRMTLALYRVSVGLAVFSLALGYALSDLWAGVVAVLATGGLWLLGQLRTLSWTSSVCLVVQTVAAAVAVLNGVWGGWPVIGLVAALVAWDLDEFAQRLRAAGRVDDVPGQERRHIQRVLIVAGIGGLLAIVGLVLQVRLSFGLAHLLAALAMLGLSLVIGIMRRAGD